MVKSAFSSRRVDAMMILPCYFHTKKNEIKLPRKTTMAMVAHCLFFSVTYLDRMTENPHRRANEDKARNKDPHGGAFEPGSNGPPQSVLTIPCAEVSRYFWGRDLVSCRRKKTRIVAVGEDRRNDGTIPRCDDYFFFK